MKMVMMVMEFQHREAPLPASLSLKSQVLKSKNYAFATVKSSSSIDDLEMQLGIFLEMGDSWNINSNEIVAPYTSLQKHSNPQEVALDPFCSSRFDRVASRRLWQGANPSPRWK